MRKPTAAQTTDALNQIEQLTRRLRHLEPNLRHRAADSSLDGYPRGTAPGGNSGHGDPVGTIVTLRIDHPQQDTLTHTHNLLVEHIHQARRLLEHAESQAHQALPPATTTHDDGCTSCARIHTWAPIHRTRRCRWCSDWAYTHTGEDPPIDILRAHHDGRRITTRLTETLSRIHHR